MLLRKKPALVKSRNTQSTQQIRILRGKGNGTHFQPDVISISMMSIYKIFFHIVIAISNVGQLQENIQVFGSIKSGIAVCLCNIK